MEKKEKRVIPKKNYVILAVICLVTIILTLYVNAWIKTYKESAYIESPLSGEVNEVNINELNEPFLEINQVILYVGYTNDQKLHAKEKELIDYINKKELNSSVMYLNVYNQDNYVNILQEKFGDEDNVVQQAPLFIYIRNGQTKVIENVKDKNDLVDTFEKIVEKYKIGDNY